MIKQEILAKVLKFQEQGWTDEQIEKAMPSDHDEIQGFLSIVHKVESGTKKVEPSLELMQNVIDSINISNYETAYRQHQAVGSKEEKTVPGSVKSEKNRTKDRIGRILLYLLAFLAIVGGMVMVFYLLSKQ